MSATSEAFIPRSPKQAVSDCLMDEFYFSTLEEMPKTKVHRIKPILVICLANLKKVDSEGPVPFLRTREIRPSFRLIAQPVGK